MTSRFQRRLLYAILAAYVVLASLYSVVTPIFEASDELWHYPMVKHLADSSLQLPLQDPTIPTLWRQEGSQPPLYYMLAAILTSGIDTSDMELVRRQNPHADIGVVRPDGNVNMIVHRSEMEAFPWHGTVLAVHVVRFFSVALGLGTVIVTYALARTIFPERPEVALGAAALNAFLPMFLFISGSVNNDNLSNLLGNLLTLLIVLLLKVQSLPPIRTFVFIGIVAGSALLSKLNIGFLIPLVALALLVVSLRFHSWRPLVMGGLVSGGLTVAIAGWWYLRNAQLYGDLTGLNIFLSIVGRRAISANAAQFWAERHSFTQAFWGFFGGVNVPLPDIVYLIFNLIGGIGLLGGITFIIYTLAKRQWALERWLPALVTVLWSIIIFISYLRWTMDTPASQGRLIFGALSSILMWITLGLTWWLPQHLRPVIITGVASFFAVVAVVVPFALIAPAYDSSPVQADTLMEEESPITTFQESASGGMVDLMNATVNTETVQPDDYATIYLAWKVVVPLSRDWSIFVHLVTPDGVIIGQRDIYPGTGLLAASDLTENAQWQDDIAVYVPAAAYAPTNLSVEIGWYDLSTSTRMARAAGSETYTIGMVELLPRQSDLDVPNPISVIFDNQIELVGYSLSDLSPIAGENVDLTLYWRGLREIDQDYIVFAHVINPPTSSIYASSDAQPANWTAPTSTWQTGNIVEDPHTLTINTNTPLGIYELEIGLYLQTEDGFSRLRIVAADGGMANDYTYLTRVRVRPREDTP